MGKTEAMVDETHFDVKIEASFSQTGQ